MLTLLLALLLPVEKDYRLFADPQPYSPVVLVEVQTAVWGIENYEVTFYGPDGYRECWICSAYNEPTIRETIDGYWLVEWWPSGN